MPMVVQVGQTMIPGPDGEPIAHRVIQALEAETGFPVAQIAVPIGEASVKLGRAVAGDDPEPKLVIPDAPPPPEDLRG